MPTVYCAPVARIQCQNPIRIQPKPAQKYANVSQFLREPDNYLNVAIFNGECKQNPPPPQVPRTPMRILQITCMWPFLIGKVSKIDPQPQTLQGFSQNPRKNALLPFFYSNFRIELDFSPLSSCLWGVESAMRLAPTYPKRPKLL